MQITKEELAKLIDHTNLHPDAKREDIERLCNEAKKYGFGAVCVYSADVEIAYEKLKDTEIEICAVVGFPHGKSPTKTKVDEAIYAIENGATEIDMVLNQGLLKDGEYEAVVKDIKAVKDAIKDRVLKVICENCNLETVELKRLAYRAAHEAGADFIKTSTGFGKYGARVEDVELMRLTIEELGSGMGIKAAGGISDAKTALKMLKAAGGYKDPKKFRIGASAGIKIIETLDEALAARKKSKKSKK
jgi:deoxyribose-phosphate aldolase